MYSRFTSIRCWVVVVVLTLSLFAGLPVLPTQELTLAPHIRAGPTSSYNWGGYAVTGSTGSVSDVKGSWIVQNVTCTLTNTYAAFWVGIDGYNSNTVEQTGTSSDCQNGSPTYYAWFEFYPKPAFVINSLTIHAGDIISAEVVYSGGKFTVHIEDITTRQSYTTSAKVNKAQRSSAEWIAEAPWSGGVLPLANFGTASYGLDYTSVGSTNYATVNGVTGPIASFASSVQQITMVSRSGSVKAQPSSLSSDGTSFTMQWLSAGP